MGNGAQALGSYVVPGFIDEIDLATGTRVQTIAIPAPCGVDSSRSYGPHLTLTPDGTHMLFGCWGTTLGAAVASSDAKIVAVVDANGYINQSHSFLTGSSGFGSVMSVDLQAFYVATASYIDLTLASQAAGVTAAHISPSGTVRSGIIRGTNLYEVTSSGLMQLGNGITLPTAAVTVSMQCACCVVWLLFGSACVCVCVCACRAAHGDGECAAD